MPRLRSNFLAGHAQRENQSRVVQPQALIGNLRVSLQTISFSSKQTRGLQRLPGFRPCKYLLLPLHPHAFCRNEGPIFYISIRGAPLLTRTTGTEEGENVAYELNLIRPLIFTRTGSKQCAALQVSDHCA